MCVCVLLTRVIERAQNVVVNVCVCVLRTRVIERAQNVVVNAEVLLLCSGTEVPHNALNLVNILLH